MGTAGAVVLPVFLVALSFLSTEAISPLMQPLAAVAKLLGCNTWNAVKVKYEIPSFGKFSLPLSTNKIGSEYELVQSHEEFPQVNMYAFKKPGGGVDPRVQVMYDSHGNICGLRVEYVINELQNRTRAKGETFPYPFDDKPIYVKVHDKILDTDVYYIDVLFIEPDVLKTGAPATRTGTVGTGIYVKLDGVTWSKMPMTEDDTEGMKFTRQGWFVGMGRHYFYKMTETMKCEDHHPVFLLYHLGELIGIGLIPFGTFDHDFGRPWFEDPPESVIKTIVPRAPPCLAQWVGKYGTASLHIYLKSFNALN